MRASQSPGASISAGVGSSREETQRRARPSGPARSTTPCTNSAPRCTCSCVEREPQQARHERVRGVALHPSPSQRLGDHAVRRQQLGADGIHHVVGDTDEAAQRSLLAGAACVALRIAVAPSSISGSAKAACSPPRLWGSPRSKRAEPIFECVRIRPVAGHVGLHQLGELGVHMGNAEHRVSRDLGETYPHPQILERERPFRREPIQVGRHDEQLVGDRERDG